MSQAPIQQAPVNPGGPIKPTPAPVTPGGPIIPAPPPVDTLNLDNIQGDILIGLPKTVEEYVFLQITDIETFRKDLSELVPLVTTTTQALADQTSIAHSKAQALAAGKTPPRLPLGGTTVAFSHSGLDKIGFPAKDLVDDSFIKGQKADAQNLGDPVNPADPTDPNWFPQYKEEIDVVIDITGDNWDRVARRWHDIEEIFGIDTQRASAKVIFKVKGNVRPGDQRGHEHFGFNDGLSQPAVKGFGAAPEPGQVAVAPGVILLGHPKPAVTTPAGKPRLPDGPVPAWATDGSFLAFRHLEQLVPEFEHFLDQNPLEQPQLSREDGSALLGARLVGRWKSGAPVELAPTKDDPSLVDQAHVNNFTFANDKTQVCPFAAHNRKTNPRGDIPPAAIDPHRIIRRGIQFGCEQTQAEKDSHTTQNHRGLAFACYQSRIDDGFKFLQQTWANNVNFPPEANDVQPGFDPIIGQNGTGAREMNGFNPNAVADVLQLPIWVIPRGGEYFFVPSIATLRDEFAFGMSID